MGALLIRKSLLQVITSTDLSIRPDITENINRHMCFG